MSDEKTYPITIHLSKEHLRTVCGGMEYELAGMQIIESLTDKDMKKIAKSIATVYLDGDYWEQLREYFESEFSYQLFDKNDEYNKN